MNILLLATRDPRGRPRGRTMVLRTIIRSLTSLGHKLTVFTIGDKEATVPTGELCGARFITVKLPSIPRIMTNVLCSNISRRKSLNECLYFSPAISRRINQLVEEEHIDVVIADMIRMAEYASRTGVPWFLDMDDLLSNRYELWSQQGLGAPDVHLLGYYGEQMSGIVRPAAARLTRHLLKWEVKVLRKREVEMAQRANGVSLVSADEARQLAGLCGKPVFNLPMALDVPSDVRPRLSARPMEMAFTGGLDYVPNLEAMTYYVDHVLPVLKQRGLGHLRLNVIGFCPDSVRTRIQNSQLELHGFVNDLYQALAQYQLFLVPLQSGSGIKTKVVEAMLLGLPVVTTPIGAQGMDLRHGEHCYIWETPEQLVQILNEMEASPERVQQIASAGRVYAIEHFAPAALERRWKEAIDLRIQSKAS